MMENEQHWLKGELKDAERRVAELEAQLQQSRDDYETALREHELTRTQLRDAQHEANNAATLREAAEFARSERDRVEGERDTARAEAKQYRELASKERSEWASADRENTRLRAGMEKVRNAHSLFDTYLGNASYMASGLGRAAMSARQLLTAALSIAGVERDETMEEIRERLDNEVDEHVDTIEQETIDDSGYHESVSPYGFGE